MAKAQSDKPKTKKTPPKPVLSRLLHEYNTTLGENTLVHQDCRTFDGSGSLLYFVKREGAKGHKPWRLIVRHRYCRQLTCATCGPDALSNLTRRLEGFVKSGRLKAVWTLTTGESNFDEDPRAAHAAFSKAFQRLKERVAYRMAKKTGGAKFEYLLTWATTGGGNLHAHVLTSHEVGQENLRKMWVACRGGVEVKEDALKPMTASKVVSYFHLKALREAAEKLRVNGLKPFLCSQSLNLRVLPKAYQGPRHERVVHGDIYSKRPHALARTTRQLSKLFSVSTPDGSVAHPHQIELPAGTDLAAIDELRPNFDRKGAGKLQLDDSRFKPVFATRDEPAPEGNRWSTFDYAAVHRMIRSRMRAKGALYVTRSGKTHTFPAFNQAAKAGARLVQYLKRMSADRCVFLRHFSLLPLIQAVHEEGWPILIAGVYGKVIERKGLPENLMSEACKPILRECAWDDDCDYTGPVQMIVTGALASDLKHQGIVLLDDDQAACSIEGLLDEHPGVHLAVHRRRDAGPPTKIATAISDAQIIRDTESWMRDPVQVDLVITPTKVHEHAEPSVGLRRMDGRIWLKPRFGLLPSSIY